MARDPLEIARGELGRTESPAGSNRTKYGAWYGWNGQPWCMMFVQWCFAQVGRPLPHRTASCGELLSWYRKYQPERIVTEPKMRDIVIYNFGHTGIVYLATNNKINAIEGNTSQGGGSQDNGGMVCRKNRPGKYIVGAVRPTFEDEKEDTMTGKEIYDALNKYMSSQKVPSKCEKEFKEAVELGITDGTNPCQLIPRWQAALMAKRAMEKK